MSSSYSVTHTDEALVITLKTNCPAALHERMLKAIARSLKSHLNDEEKTIQDSKTIRDLVTLLEAMLPGESTFPV